MISQNQSCHLQMRCFVQTTLHKLKYILNFQRHKSAKLRNAHILFTEIQKKNRYFA